MASGMFLFFVSLLPGLLLALAETCEGGERSCSVRAAALLQRHSRQTTNVDSGVESLYGGEVNGYEVIEGRFHLAVNPSALAGQTPKEMKKTQDAGMQALKETLAQELGFGLTAADIHLRYETSGGGALLQLDGQLVNLVCVFTFACPAAVAPADVVNAMSNITAADFMVKLQTSLPDSALAPRAFTATYFVGTTPGPMPSSTTSAATTSTSAPSTSSSAASTSTQAASTSTAAASTSTSKAVVHTTEAPNRTLHPCATDEDYMPEARMYDHGWCVMDANVDPPNESTCKAHNCSAYGYPDTPHCQCLVEEGCKALGGEWKYHTCKDEISMFSYGDYKALIEEAMEKGTCSGLKTSWDQNLMEILDWPARKCCQSWPKTLCEPLATLASPCKDVGDFLADKLTNHGSTCLQWMKSWYQEYHVLKNVSIAGSCENVEFAWGQKVSEWVTGPAQECCQSYPASLCDKDARFMTPCTSDQDFLGSKVMHAHCQLHPAPDNVTCESSGCHYGHSHCHCPEEASCVVAGGTWYQHTCEKEIRNWPIGKHDALQEALEEGACGDLDYPADLDMETDWVARTCCASYPARVCDTAATKASPCKDASDFQPEGVVAEWCELFSVDEATCKAGGCRFDGWCHCPSASPCAAVGGKWRTWTCAEDVSHWDAAKHAVLRKASQNRSCADTDFHGQSVEAMISGLSQKCCVSFPATACDPEVQMMTPCRDSEDFEAERPLHAWCDFRGSLPVACNVTAGCQDLGGSCHCGTEAGCVALGGGWLTTTCGQEIGNWTTQFHKAIQGAKGAGTCQDTDWHGQALADVLRYPAEKCCASYPASACDPGARKMTPCKEASDFLPTAVTNTWCEFASVPDGDTCVAHGCTSQPHGCHCGSMDSCQGAGGTWQVNTCEVEVGHWQPEMHKALQEAEESKTCEAAHPVVGDLKGTVRWAAEKCCASYPASVCDKEAKRMTPCKDEMDYMPDKVMWAYCDFYHELAVMPSEAVCNDRAGCYGGEGWCHCEDQASCEAVGGMWNAHTCQMQMAEWQPEQHKMLQKADELGTCEDLEVNGMRVKDLVSWPAQQCCQSFPASVCDKDLKPMTPCLRSEDFMHNKTQWAYCNLFPAPAEADCLAQGCSGNEHYCHCEEEASCVALGGKWNTYQCWQDLQHMQAEVHKGIGQAVAQGTCEGVEVYQGSKLEYAVDWLGNNCCSSGMSVCKELQEGGGSSLYDSVYGK